jgi:hypothetical protein
VLPIPSRSGQEGPPRPFTAEPRAGSPAPPTPGRLAVAQDRALLDGPFPRGGLTRAVSEGSLLLEGAPSSQRLALARIRASGASVVRIPVDWRSIVVGTPSSGLDAADPGASVYRFTAVDQAVSEAAAAGLQPLLVVSHAPAFAEASPRWPYAYPGSWAPSPQALQAFAQALARRYDGRFADPANPARRLPRVRLFQAWNEPNLARYLEPQWVAEGGRWVAFSALIYRQLLNGFYAGIKAAVPGDRVIFAGLAPNGDPDGVGRMAPVRFLRAALCLTPPGQAEARVRRARCPDPAHFDVLAFHPLSVGNPDRVARSSLDVAIADASKITSVLRRAERLHTALPAAVKPVWVTELNWESGPGPGQGVPARLQPLWISRALHRLWVAGVSLVAWQFLMDPFPGARAQTPSGSLVEYARPAGLYAPGSSGDLETATPKPFLRGFALPFDPLRVDRGHVRVWALLGAAHAPVELQRLQAPRVWRTIARQRAGGDGVLNTLLALRGSITLRLRSRTLTSAPEHVPGRRVLP